MGRPAERTEACVVCGADFRVMKGRQTRCSACIVARRCVTPGCDRTTGRTSAPRCSPCRNLRSTRPRADWYFDCADCGRRSRSKIEGTVRCRPCLGVGRPCAQCGKPGGVDDRCQTCREPELLRLILPTADPGGLWRFQATCSQLDDLDVMYVDEDTPDKNLATEQARKHCLGCPVRSECLTVGLFEDDGIWGGATYTDRMAVRRHVPRPEAQLCRAGLHRMTGHNVSVLASGERRCKPCRRAAEERKRLEQPGPPHGRQRAASRAVVDAHRAAHGDQCPGWGVDPHHAVRLQSTGAGVLCKSCTARWTRAGAQRVTDPMTGQPELVAA